jgi:hypothetical protein
MAYATTTHGNECQAFVSVKRNRSKQYENKTVYLQNNEEFELELFNPTTYKFLAKIKLNGNYISSTGIVLKPGQRVFLERYLDDAKKFKFETYTVSNSKESLDAIQKNGLVEVEFYQEFTPSNFNNYTSPINWYNSFGSITTGGSNVLYSTNSSSPVVGTITTNSVNLNQVSGTITNTSGLNLNSVKNLKETGRVETGSASNQEFKNDFGNYNSWISNVVTWKILPKSEKPYESSDLKTYCTNCGHKIKKTNWKFCPACGNKLS